MRILLIDDEATTLERLRYYLTELGHVVEEIGFVRDESGLQEAIRQYHPDGVILDYEMDPNGVKIYQWIKKWRESTKIVFYTKYGRSPDKVLRMLEVCGLRSRIVVKEETADDIERLMHGLRE
jgi:DNA-binding NarL/FixJ family response regulator